MKQPLSLTINAQGEIQNASEFDPDVIAQLSTAEAKERMRKQYKDYYGSGRREIRKELNGSRRQIVQPGNQRSFEDSKPAGMSNMEWRKLRKKMFRDLTKRTLRDQRRQRHAISVCNAALSDHSRSA